MKAISIAIPVYMEAKNVAAATESVTWAVGQAGFDDYEIMIIDCLREDGTHDGTPEIAEGLARNDQHIKVFHNKYINLGKKFWIGVDNARFPHMILVAGDNELTKESIQDVIKHIGEADVVTSYVANTEVRPLMRRLISWTFVGLMNVITGLRLKYYNGMCVHDVDLLKTVKERNESFAYMAVVSAEVLRAGHTFKEIPIKLQKRVGGKPAAFKRDNIIAVSKTLLKLFWKYRIKSA
jgi:dolichol-phosphate mannosyltransferase